MALTQADEEVLVVVGMHAARDLDAGQLLVVDELAHHGLAEWSGEVPALTAAGRTELDRLLMD